MCYRQIVITKDRHQADLSLYSVSYVVKPTQAGDPHATHDEGLTGRFVHYFTSIRHCKFCRSLYYAFISVRGSIIEG